MDDIPALSDEIGLFRKAQLFRHQSRHIHADGRGRGQAGGLDADGLEEVLAALPDIEVVAAALQMGPQAGEAGNDVPHGQVRHAAARRGDGVIQPRLGGSSVVPVLLIRGRYGSRDRRPSGPAGSIRPGGG